MMFACCSKKTSSMNHMSSKGVSTRHSNSTTSQWDSQPIGNLVLGTQANTISYGGQPDTLEWLTRQVHELIITI